MAKVQTTSNTVTTRGTRGVGLAVKPREVVKIIWNGSDKFHSAGSVSELHPVQFQKMIDRGWGEEWSEDRERELADAKQSKSSKRVNPAAGNTVKTNLDSGDITL
jgi:hypothetical protein